MQSSDFKLRYVITGDNRELKKVAADTDSVLDGLGGQNAGKLAALAGPAAAVGAGVLAIGAAAITAGTHLFELTKAASEFGSEIFDATKKTQLSAETISSLKFAADQSGSSLEAITGSVSKFARAVSTAGESSEKSAEFLKDFGVTPQEAIQDLDGALASVFAKIQAAPAGLQRTILAQKAFGKSGADILPILDSFDGDLAGLIDKAKKLGVTIDDDAAAASDRFGDALDTLSLQVGSLGRAVGYKLMPPLSDALETMSEFVADKADDFERFLDNTEVLIKGLAGYWRDATTALDGYLNRFDRLQGVSPSDIGTGGFGLTDNPLIPRLKRSIEHRGGKGEGAGYAAKDAGGGVSAEQQQEFEDIKRARQKAFEDELKNRSQQNQILLRGERQQYAEAQRALETALNEKQITQAAYEQSALQNVEAYYQKTRNLLFQSLKTGSTGKSGTALENEKLEYANAVKALDAETERERADIRKRTTDAEKKAVDETITNAQRAVDRTLELYRAGYDQREAELDARLKAEAISESEHVRQIGRVRIEALMDEETQLRNLLKTAGMTAEKRADIEHKLAVLSKTLAVERIRQATAWGDAIRKEAADAAAAIEDADAMVRKASYDKDTTARASRAAGTTAATAVGRVDQKTRYAREQLLADLDYARESLKIERDAALKRATGLQNELKVKAAIREAYRLKELGLEEEYQKALTELGKTYAKERAEAAEEDNPYKRFSQSWKELVAEMEGAVGLTNIIDTVGSEAVQMFDNMAAAVGSAVEGWALYGDSVGTALKKALAAELAHMAGVAAVKAIYATALGFLMLAEQNYVAAGNAFVSAGIWAAVAGGSAIAAKAVAGDSFKGKGSASSKGSDSQDPNFGSNINKNPDPFRRDSEFTYVSGRDSPFEGLRQEVRALHQKIGSMKPGDVVTAGLGQTRGLVSDTLIREANSGRSIDLGKALGMR